MPLSVTFYKGTAYIHVTFLTKINFEIKKFSTYMSDIPQIMHWDCYKTRKRKYVWDGIKEKINSKVDSFGSIYDRKC